MTEPNRRPERAPNDLLSVDDLAARLAVSYRTVYRLAAAGALPVYNLPSGMRFKVSEVDAYLESCRGRRVGSRRHYERAEARR